MVNYNALSRVVAVATGKGGTGKTSLAVNAAGLMAAAGHKVLLIDLDPQADTADDLGYFADPRHDDGTFLAECILEGKPLHAQVAGVRPNLDVVSGGIKLKDVPGIMFARRLMGNDLLSKCLEPIAEDYDLIVIDTPPNDDVAQSLAMDAARWLLIPTKADPSSIKAIKSIGEKCSQARDDGRDIDILGVVLVDMDTMATRVRRNAEEMVAAVLGDQAPVFKGMIRHAPLAAQETRKQGRLVHELAEAAENAEPFWTTLRKKSVGAEVPGLGAFDETPSDGTEPRVVPSAPALASDYVAITEQVLRRIDALEEAAEGAA